MTTRIPEPYSTMMSLCTTEYEFILNTTDRYILWFYRQFGASRKLMMEILDCLIVGNFGLFNISYYIY